MHPAPQHHGVNGCHDQQTNGIHLFGFTYVLYNMSHNPVVCLFCALTKSTPVRLEEAVWSTCLGSYDSIVIIRMKCVNSINLFMLLIRRGCPNSSLQSWAIWQYMHILWDVRNWSAARHFAILWYLSLSYRWLYEAIESIPRWQQSCWGQCVRAESVHSKSDGAEGEMTRLLHSASTHLLSSLRYPCSHFSVP